jgi:tripartite-type tricarboxylate transporter receptor subunit TctC
MKRRASRFITACIGALLTSTICAQDIARYPERPIRLIVPYAPGGSLDIIGRIVAQKLTDRMGQTVVVDNRAGGTAIIGTEILAAALPNGYTIMIANIAHGANPSLRKKMPYDAEKDFAPVSMLVQLPGMLVVHPSVRARSTAELIALAKAKPGELTYASSGVGSSNHLFMELLKISTATQITHVAYKGGGPALVDLVGGQVKTMIVAIPPALPFVKDGKLIALGVTSAKRMPVVTDVPTIMEAGIKDFEVSDWLGILLPAGSPAPIVNRLNKEITSVLQLPDVRERVSGMGAVVATSTPAELAAYIHKELALWAKVIKQSGIAAD